MARKLPVPAARKPPAARKLKVFRTTIGFHDAYVAAPSRKAALAAWGSDADLFARGVAEEVTDPALTAEALAKPGEVIRRARGTADEYFAALPRTPARPAAAHTPPPPPRKAKPRPPPSRAALDAAEAAIDAAQSRFDQAAAALARREQALAKERRTLEAEHRDGMVALANERDAAQAAYDKALKDTSA